MVLRDKRINTTAKNVQLSVSYGESDVRDMIKWLCKCYVTNNSDFDLVGKLKTPWTEQDLLYALIHDPRCFGNYQEKWARMLAEWCLKTALRIKMIEQSIVGENSYYFAECCVERHRGRPCKTI